MRKVERTKFTPLCKRLQVTTTPSTGYVPLSEASWSRREYSLASLQYQAIQPHQLQTISITSSGGEDAMESEDLHLLDDSHSTEQDLKVGEGEYEMWVAPTDKLELVPEAMVEEVSLQEKVSETGNKDTGKV